MRFSTPQILFISPHTLFCSIYSVVGGPLEHELLRKRRKNFSFGNSSEVEEEDEPANNVFSDGIPVSDSGKVKPSDILDWTFLPSHLISIPGHFGGANDWAGGQLPILTPIYIASAKSASSTGGENLFQKDDTPAPDPADNDELSMLHAAFLTASWSKWGAKFLRVTSFLLLQFFVVPSIVTGEWYILKTWFHWPRDTVESLILVAIIKSVWWSMDLYQNYRLTRELLILDYTNRVMKEGGGGGRTGVAGGTAGGAGTAGTAGVAGTAGMAGTAFGGAQFARERIAPADMARTRTPGRIDRSSSGKVGGSRRARTWRGRGRRGFLLRRILSNPLQNYTNIAEHSLHHRSSQTSVPATIFV